MTAPRPIPWRSGLWIGALALAVRALWVLWAPGEATGDARWYHTYASFLMRGAGYVELDGSPAVQWMPGWPLLLAGVYSVAGAAPRAGMALNAFLGAASAGLLVVLGARLFRREVGVAAGALYALWPGLVYFSATLMTETAFSFFLVACLALLADGAASPPSSGSRRPMLIRCVASGLCFGAAALTKGEPWVLIPMLALFLWTSLRSVRSFAMAAAAFGVAAALVVAPWVVRNYGHFDRVLVTSASGGVNAWIGNHPGATGGEMIGHSTRYAEAHRGANRAETSLRTNDAGWRDVLAFARSEPGTVAVLAVRKLRLTYGSDDGGLRMVRGVRRKTASLDPVTDARLAALANGFWWVALGAAAVGLCTLGSWSAPARVLVLGLPASWLLVHAVFLGGPRFHVPEIPAIALAAGCGIDWLARRQSGGEATGPSVA